ncbi:MAG: serine protease [Cyanobacteriota bacterium]
MFKLLKTMYFGLLFICLLSIMNAQAYALGNNEVNIIVEIKGSGETKLPLSNTGFDIYRISRSASFLGKENNEKKELKYEKTITTNPEGLASAYLNPGDYIIKNEVPFEYDYKLYKWVLEFTKEKNKPININLNTNNVNITQLERPTYPDLKYTERDLINHLKNSVVTVETDRGAISGFIIDNSGLIITTNNIIEDSLDYNIILDGISKVKANLVTEYPDKNIAVLIVNPEHIKDKTPIKFAQTTDNKPLLKENAKLFLIANPLKDQATIFEAKPTASSGNSLLTNIEMDYYMSGSPILNTKGQVVAIGYYKDLSLEGKEIVNDIINVADIYNIIDESKEKIVENNISIPENNVITLNSRSFPNEIFEQALETDFNIRNYTFKTGPFTVLLHSPPSYYNLNNKNKIEKHKLKRKKRNNKNQEATYPGVNPDSPFIEIKEWCQETENFKPYLFIEVSPKTGQTSGSAARGFASFLLGEAIGVPVYLGSKTLEFKDDFYNMELLVNGKVVEPLRRGRELNQALYYEYFKNLTTNSHSGLFYYDPLILISNNPEEPVNIEIRLYKASEKDTPINLKLKEKTIKLLLDDFQPYFDQLKNLN